MMTKEQARRTAQILYPQVFASNPLEAVAKAIEFLHEAAGEPAPSAHLNDSGSDAKTSAVVEALRAHMKRAHLHVNVTARAIGVSAYTVRTWLEGKYAPNEANTKKIANFLEQLDATPEILTP
jgi:DNA-binding transcriptional regulator YiaG